MMAGEEPEKEKGRDLEIDPTGSQHAIRMTVTGREETAVSSWVPTTGIDYDVISEEITLLMGPKATVERGKLANVRYSIYDDVIVADPVQDNRPGYIIRGPYALTIVRSFLFSLAQQHHAD
jgi:hypothetical protein